ncbi:MAG: SRPBCC domain-containing protein [Acidimicrobiia bacterium]
MDELLPKVERSVDLSVSPDIAWSHLINGELATLWMGGTMSIEPRLGGKVHLATDGLMKVFGTVEEMVARESITWAWRTAEGEPTQVTLRLEPREIGCRLHVTEQMVPYEIVYVPPFRD